jgi:hypothetical protein
MLPDWLTFLQTGAASSSAGAGTCAWRIANFLSIIEFATHRLLAPVDMLRAASLAARIRRCARSVVGFWPNKEEKFLAMLPATVDQGDRSRSPLS